MTYKGNYSDYLVERELRREQQQREYENQQSLINKTQEFIRRNLEGQKTKQAKSRRNMLQRMERIEAVASEKAGGTFGLKKVERTGNNVLTLEDMSIGYPTRTLATGLNLSLHRGEALGIIGANGTGKTTLLKTVLGDLPELDGKLMWGTKANIGYYAQNLEGLEPRNEVIQELRRVAPLADNGTLRGFLAKFLFFGEDVFKNVSALSGGEKGRLALAKLIYSERNVLVLDEPTNHLDIPAREALETALQEYTGTVVVVSHDRYFLDEIASQILSFERDGSILQYSGNYTEFHDWKHQSETPGLAGAITEQAETPPAGSVRVTDDTRGLSRATKAIDDEAHSAKSKKQPQSNLSKNQRDRVEKRIAEIEAEISRLEDESKSKTTELSNPKIAGDYTRLKSATDEITKIESRIKSLYEDWEQLSASI